MQITHPRAVLVLLLVHIGAAVPRGLAAEVENDPINREFAEIEFELEAEEAEDASVSGGAFSGALRGGGATAAPSAGVAGHAVSASLGDDAAIDCAAIGMGRRHCDPAFAKVIAHIMFPADGNCNRIAPIPIRDCNLTPKERLELRGDRKPGMQGDQFYWANTGWGADTHSNLGRILQAAATHRAPALVVAPHHEAGWWEFNDWKNSFCPGKEWYECYFEPYTSCALPAACTAGDDPDIFLSTCGTSSRGFVPESDPEGPIARKIAALPNCRATAAAAHAPAMSTRVPTAAEIAKWTGKGSARTNMIRAVHAVALFMRPEAKLKQYFETIKQKIGVRRGEKRVGVHIRHSDYIIEGPEVAVGAYCIATAKIMRDTGIRNIYVATDDPAITELSFAECVESHSARLGIAGITGVHVSMQKWGRSSGGDTTAQAIKAGVRDFALAGLVDIHLLADCDALVISAGSGFSMTALYLAASMGKATHYHIMNCAHSEQVIMELEMLEKHLPNFHNMYQRGEPPHECIGQLKHVLVRHEKCSVTDPALEAHIGSTLNVRGTIGLCIDQYLNYMPAGEECDLMCIGGGRSCSFLVPRDRVHPTYHDWVSPTTGCVLVQDVSRETCVMFSKPQCTNPALWDPRFHSHRMTTAEERAWKRPAQCQVQGYNWEERCELLVHLPTEVVTEP